MLIVVTKGVRRGRFMAHLDDLLSVIVEVAVKLAHYWFYFPPQANERRKLVQAKLVPYSPYKCGSLLLSIDLHGKLP